jgi:hypothetical protein
VVIAIRLWFEAGSGGDFEVLGALVRVLHGQGLGVLDVLERLFVEGLLNLEPSIIAGDAEDVPAPPPFAF